MSLEAVIQEARDFERSSHYRHGDKTAFSIQLTEGVVLKGPNSAAAYLDQLGLTELPERVMIVGPGNGGLAVECYARGAKRVIVMEPRTRFQFTLHRIMSLKEKIWKAKETAGLSWRLVTTWEQIRDNDGFKDVDLIVWAEGLEEITHPKEIFRTLDTALNPGGRLMVEARLGRHKWVEKINSWYPSEHAMADMSKEIFGGRWASKGQGRYSQSSAVFTIVKPGAAKPTKKAAPKKKKKKAAKSEAPREVHLDLTKEEKPKAAPKKKKTKKKAKRKKKVSKKTKDDEPLVLLDAAPEGAEPAGRESTDDKELMLSSDLTDLTSSAEDDPSED